MNKLLITEYINEDKELAYKVEDKYSIYMLIVNRRKVGMVHHYMHTYGSDVLVGALENSNTKPKHKQKINNELVKRGFDLGLVNNG